MLYSAYPAARSTGEVGGLFSALGSANGEKVTPFSFVQLSDAHVGFNGPPDPLGTKAFERAVDMINALPKRPDLVLFTGDLTHDTEDRNVHVQRMKQFQEISRKINVPMVKCVPGEHDAGLITERSTARFLVRPITRSIIAAFTSSASTMFRGPNQRSVRISLPGSRKIWRALRRALPSLYSRIVRCSTFALTGSGLPATATT